MGSVLDAPFPIAGTPLSMSHRDDLNLLRQFSENHEEGVAVKQNSSGPIKIRGANLRGFSQSAVCVPEFRIETQRG